MKRVFADTSYWVAVINPSDQWAQAAQRATAEIGKASILTSVLVLVEVLNFFSSRGPELIRAAADIVARITPANGAGVVETSVEDLRTAAAMYRKRCDQGYSLTDCASMQTMHRFHISDVLTSDEHFAREGFRAMMLRH